MGTRTRLGIVVATLVASTCALLLIRGDGEREAPPSSPSASRSDGASDVAPKGTTAPTLPSRASDSPPAESPSARPLSGPGRIFGTATLPDGEPAATVVLELHRVDARSPLASYADTFFRGTEVTSGEEFSIDQLPVGNYQIYASTPTHVGQHAAQLSLSHVEQRITVTLAPGGTISGRVIDGNRAPVPGANVFVGAHDVGGSRRDASRERALSSRVATDVDGRFTMGHLRLSTDGEPGYRLGVKADGFAALLSDYIQAGTADVELVLSAGAVVSGSLLLSGTDEPVPNETVLLESKFSFERLAGTTDAEGFFFIPGVPAGTQVAELVDSEYVIVPESVGFEVPADARAAEVTLLAMAGGVVSGRVYNVDTDEGIADVQLGVTVGDIYKGQHAATGADGRYRIAGLTPIPIKVHLDLPRGYTFPDRVHLSPNLTPSSGAEISNIDFPLTRGMTISGIVVNEDGEPIAGADVEATDEDGRYTDRTRTDQNGAFRLSGFPKGVTVRTYASKRGFALPTGHWRESPKYTLDENCSGITITMLTASRVSGTAVDERGRPMQGAGMTVQTITEPPLRVRQTGSGADGTVEFEDIPPGEYLIGVDSNSSGLIDDERTAVRVRVTAGEDISGLRFVVPGGRSLSISGRVVDARGAPLARAQVAVTGIDHDYTPRGWTVLTDASGAFEIPNLASGAHNIWATLSGFAGTEQVRVEAGASDVVLTLKDFGRIEGRVISAASGLPVTVFSINFRNEPETIRDAEGRFTIEKAIDRVSLLRVSAEGYAFTNVLLPAVAGGETYRSLVVRLEAGATLSGRVTNGEGQPIRGASLSLYPGTGDTYADSPPTASSGADGMYQLHSLPTGPHTLRVYHQQYASALQSVTIAPGAQNRADIVLSTGSSIAGLVTLKTRPVPNAEVYAEASRNSGGHTTTDAQGRYRIERLHPGEAKVSASSQSPEGSRHGYVSATVEEGRVTEVNIELNAGTASIEGTIFAQPGVPLRTRTGISAQWEPEGRVYAQSDADGTFLIDGLPAGVIFVTVDAGARTQKTVAVEVAAGQRARRDIVLSAGSTLSVEIEGTLADRNFPVRAVVCAGAVVLREWSDEIVSDLVGIEYGDVEHGRCEFRNLEPGTYTVVAWETDIAALLEGNQPIRRWTSAIVEVSDEDEQTLRLAL